MAEYIEIGQLWKCETCYHSDQYGCLLGGFGCDHGESYRPDYGKLKKADVAPVVRCKNCLHWQDNNGGYPHDECRWDKDETPDADDFCSYGERKDGGGDAN